MTVVTEGYIIEGATFGYMRLYGCPDPSVFYPEYGSVPLNPGDNPDEYIKVTDDGYYRLCVDVPPSECSFFVEFTDGVSDSMGGVTPEVTNTGFLVITREGNGYNIWCKENKTRYDRNVSLFFLSSTEPDLRIEIPVRQKCHELAIKFQNETDSVFEMDSLLENNTYEPEIKSIPLVCTGGKKDFVVNGVTCVEYYGDGVDEENVCDIEFDSSDSHETGYDDKWIEMFSIPKDRSGWKEDNSSGECVYYRYGGVYYKKYAKGGDIWYSKVLVGKDPSLGGKYRLYRKRAYDNAVVASNNGKGNLVLVNYGRLYKKDGNDPSVVYEFTVSHVSDLTKHVVIKAFYY